MTERPGYAPDSISLVKPNRPDLDQGKIGLRFGAYYPKQILANQQMEDWGTIKNGKGELLSAADIFHKTGVERRYVANEKETVFYMACEAAQDALRGNTGNIDSVIVTTSYVPEFDLSERLQKEFGFSGSNLDVYAACTGIGTRFKIFQKQEQRFLGQKMLIVATESTTQHLEDLSKEGGSERDKSLAQTLFSDGAHAVVLEYGKDLKVLSVKQRVFEGTGNYIRMPVDRSKLQGRHCFEAKITYPASGKFEQDGPNVYKAIRNGVPNLIRASIMEAKKTPDDIAWLFPHQGSKPVVEYGIKDQLPELKGRVWMDLSDGNPSSGSGPKGLMRAVAAGEIKKGDIVNITLFGASEKGMIAASATLQI